jgi:formate-dependent nitrite reductase membrane component NrfD
MLAAEIWHWWIGVAMLIAGIGATVGLLVGYLKQVSAQRYPGGKRQRELDL